MDFTQIIEIIKQVVAYIQESGIIEKFKEVAPIIFEKGVELIKGYIG